MSGNYQLRLTPQFKADFQAVLRYITIDLSNPIAANALIDELDDALEQVQTYPFSVRPFPTKLNRPEVYRAVGVKRYMAFYVVLDGVVEFRRFLYSGSDYASRL